MVITCPNCEALMEEGEGCPECNHEDHFGCECRTCSESRSIDID